MIAQYGSWAAQVDNAGGLDYNGQPTIRAKSELARNEAGGVMFWELSQDTTDDTSLLNTIWNVVGDLTKDTSTPTPPSTGNVANWQAGTWYPVGSIVRYNGQLYIAVHENPGYDPVISHWFWDEYSGTGSASQPQAGRYALRAVHSNKCLDVNAAGVANGVNIQQYSCNGTGAQLFELQAVSSGFYRLVNSNSRKSVDIAGWSTADGGNIHQWDSHSGDNQLFKFNDKGAGRWEIRSKWSDKCVDVAAVSTADRANVQQWSCNNKLNQQWVLEPR